MFYNVALVSAIQQWESAITIYPNLLSLEVSLPSPHHSPRSSTQHQALNLFVSKEWSGTWVAPCPLIVFPSHWFHSTVLIYQLASLLFYCCSFHFHYPASMCLSEWTAYRKSRRSEWGEILSQKASLYWHHIHWAQQDVSLLPWFSYQGSSRQNRAQHRTSKGWGMALALKVGQILVWLQLKTILHFQW